MIGFSWLFIFFIGARLPVTLHLGVSAPFRPYFPCWERVCVCGYCCVCVWKGYRRGVAGQTDSLGLEGMSFLHRRWASTGAFICPSVEPKTKTDFQRLPAKPNTSNQTEENKDETQLQYTFVHSRVSVESGPLCRWSCSDTHLTADSVPLQLTASSGHLQGEQLSWGESS